MNNYRFPKYARLTGFKSSIMMRVSESNDGMSAYYYRPCGEWGCTINLKNYKYTSSDPCMRGQEINLISCTPREFIEDNSYCVLKSTTKYYNESIEDIAETEPTFDYGYVYTNIMSGGPYPYIYIPKITYKEIKTCNKYLYFDL